MLKYSQQDIETVLEDNIVHIQELEKYKNKVDSNIKKLNIEVNNLKQKVYTLNNNLIVTNIALVLIFICLLIK